MKIIRYILFYILFFNTLLVYPQKQKLRFDRLSIESGLSQSSINSLYQDTDGFLWIGTNDGLNRYDGIRFRIFRYESKDSTSLSQNMIRSICEDSENRIWIGTENGLCSYNKETENFTRYFSDPQNNSTISNNHVRQIVEDQEGFLWIATTVGINKYDKKNSVFTRFLHHPDSIYSLADNFCRTIFVDSRNNIWIGTEIGVDQYDRLNNRFTHLLIDSQREHKIGEYTFLCFLEDEEGEIWAGTRNGGVYKFSNSGKSFIRYNYDQSNPNSLSSNSVHAILSDNFGDIWIGTYGTGLNKFDKQLNGFLHFENSPWEQSSLSNNSVTRIYEDQSEIIWIGTNFSGLNKYDRRKSQFLLYMNDPKNPKSLKNNSITAICEDPEDAGKTMWLGTLGSGFGLFNRETEDFSFYSLDSPSHSISNNIIRSILKDSRGVLWIGTDYGIYRYHLKLKKYLPSLYHPDKESGLGPHVIKYLYEDSEGLLWIGTNGGGLALFNPNDNSIKAFGSNVSPGKSVNDNIIWCIRELKEGSIWFGTNSGGVNVFNKKTGVFTYHLHDSTNPNSLSHNKVLCMYESASGDLWIGTAGGGVDKYDKVNNGFIHYTTENGLATNTIHAIVEDKEKNLWITTNRGLCRMNPETGIITNFDNNDGLQSNEFHVNAAVRSVTGEIFLGGIDGLNIFRPEEIKRNEHVPQLVFTDFKLFNRSIPIGEEINERIYLHKSVTKTQSITLSHNDEVFSFEFASLDFANPERNQYAYIMEGFEKDWNYVGNRNYATYTKLPAGEYIFRVKGSNNSGIWNEEGIALHITITPPVSEKLWFRIIFLLLVSLVVFIVYKSRVRYLENRRRTVEVYNRNLSQEIKERKETEKKLIEAKELAEKANQLKSEFLAQISHEIRSPINIVLSYLGLIKEELKGSINNTISDSFTAIDTANARIVRTIDLILNMSEVQLGIYQPTESSIHLVNDVLKNLIVEYNNKAGKKGLKLNLESSIENPVIICDRYSVTQIFANLIDNAIKYSEKGTISVEINPVNENILEVVVKDEGIGIAEEYLPNLFEEFTQEEHGYSRSFEGNGLGLALVKKYCNINNAEINVESKKGSGTKVILKFPRKN